MVQEQIIAIFTMMIAIRHEHPLRGLNSFGLEARASHFAGPEHLEDLCRILDNPEYSPLPMLILGEGSNILFRNDFDGLVLQPRMKGITLVEEGSDLVTVKVGASENWDKWVHYSLQKGWYGLENLSMIPGSVGSSPVQNIGAYGVELRDRFAWLEAWDLQEKQLKRMDPEACRFGYRNSIFKEDGRERFIITQVAFRLNRKPELKLDYGNVHDEFARAGGSSPMDLRNVIMDIRRSKLPDPALYGNAGSFFKNPLVDRSIFRCIRVEYPEIPSFPDKDNQVKIPAGWLIEKSGWKGKRIGNVGTWPTQALVIVNYGGASGKEIFDFSEMIIEDVDRIFGITLEREVNVI